MSGEDVADDAGVEQCIYCEHPPQNHPVIDDNGGLACTGMEGWFS